MCEVSDGSMVVYKGKGLRVNMQASGEPYVPVYHDKSVRQNVGETEHGLPCRPRRKVSRGSSAEPSGQGCG